MEEDLLELHQHQQNLVNDFIKTNNLKSFKKMLNARTTPREKKTFFQSARYVKPTDMIRKYKQQQRQFHLQYQYQYQYPPHYQYQHQQTYSNYNPYSKTLSNQDDFTINRYQFIDDPHTKDKCMKGNFKWGSQKFQMIKYNLAKRKGIPFNEFTMPKMNNDDNIKKCRTDINGDVLTQTQTKVTLPKII